MRNLITLFALAGISSQLPLSQVFANSNEGVLLPFNSNGTVTIPLGTPNSTVPTFSPSDTIVPQLNPTPATTIPNSGLTNSLPAATTPSSVAPNSTIPSTTVPNSTIPQYPTTVIPATPTPYITPTNAYVGPYSSGFRGRPLLGAWSPQYWNQQTNYGSTIPYGSSGCSPCGQSGSGLMPMNVNQDFGRGYDGFSSGW